MIPDLKQRVLASQYADMPKISPEEDQRELVSPREDSQLNINVSETERHQYIDLQQTPTNTAASTVLVMNEEQPTNRKCTNRRPKRLVPDNHKDHHYWEKRKKNNDAARKSRDLKRRKENNIRQSVTELHQHNIMLQEELQVLKRAFNLSTEKRYVGISRDGRLLSTSIFESTSVVADKHPIQQTHATYFSPPEMEQSISEGHYKRGLDTQGSFDSECDSKNAEHFYHDFGRINRTNPFKKGHYSRDISDLKANQQLYAQRQASSSDSVESRYDPISLSELSQESTDSVSSPALYTSEAKSVVRPVFEYSPYIQQVKMRKNTPAVRLAQQSSIVPDRPYSHPYLRHGKDNEQIQKTKEISTEMPVCFEPKNRCNSHRTAGGDCGCTARVTGFRAYTGEAFQKIPYEEDPNESRQFFCEDKTVIKSSVNRLQNNTVLHKFHHQLKSPEKRKLFSMADLRHLGAGFGKFKHVAE